MLIYANGAQNGCNAVHGKKKKSEKIFNVFPVSVRASNGSWNTYGIITSLDDTSWYEGRFNFIPLKVTFSDATFTRNHHTWTNRGSVPARFLWWVMMWCTPHDDNTPPTPLIIESRFVNYYFCAACVSNKCNKSREAVKMTVGKTSLERFLAAAWRHKSRLYWKEVMEKVLSRLSFTALSSPCPIFRPSWANTITHPCLKPPLCTGVFFRNTSLNVYMWV